MRIDEASRDSATMRGAYAAAVVLLAVLAVGASIGRCDGRNDERTKGRWTKEGRPPASAGASLSPRTRGSLIPRPSPAGSRPVPKLRSTYVPGEVIVRLREGRTGGVGLFSVPGAGGNAGTLLRLRAAYGLSEERPIFRGAKTRSDGRKDERTMDERKASLVPHPPASAGASLSPRTRGSSRLYLFKTDRDVRSICAELRNDPDVEYAQPNYIYKRCGDPNDPEFADQYAHQLIQMSKAWDISTGSRDIVVAVLDTGVDVNHPDLKDNIWVNEDEIPDNDIDDDNNGFIDDVAGWNFESNNNDVTPEFDWSGVEGHGTMVSGVIAGVGNNGIGVSGVNWTISIMALRLGTEITTADVAAGLDYAAANGAHVANMSFGGDDSGPEGDQAVKMAIDNAYAQGVLLVASAGNDDTALPQYPAAYYNVMAVSSTNGEDIKTGHSSFGHWVDIAAPGTDIVTTDLENEYISTAGTSFSGPYVAAVGALVLSHRPDLTHVEIRAILENTTDPVDYGAMDPNLGYVGTGRVNAYKALLESDRRHPLGEIVEPMPQQTLAPDGNDIAVTLFVHGDSYRLEYSPYSRNDWILLDDGSSPVDANGFVHLSLANPGIGVFDLRLTVTTDGYRHTDRKLFGIELGPSLAPWPMPDLPDDPMELPDEMYYGSPLCLDVDGDGRNEIVQSTMVWADYGYDGRITIWKDDGTPLTGWPKPVGETLWGSLVASGLAVGDIDGDGDYEIVAVDDYEVMATALHVETGEVVEGNWPTGVGDYWYAYIIGSPILADLDGDGDSEIIIGHDAESADTDGLFALQGDGSFLWQRRYTTWGPMSVADFDGDGDVEIALCGYGPGITRAYTFILDHNGQQIARWRGGSNKGTAIGDLDADGVPELVFCTEDSVMAVHIDGSKLWETEIMEWVSEYGAMCIGDVDGDGFSEVYVSSYIEEYGFAYTLVHAFDHEGRLLSEAGFPKTLMGDPWDCSPLVGDIDGDGQKELVVGSAGAATMAWEADGSVVAGFPMLGLAVDYNTSPTLQDLDGDGDLELIANGFDYQFHVLDLPGAYDPAMIDWGMARHDAQMSGWALPSPKLDPLTLPKQAHPGQKLEALLTASYPAGVTARLVASSLPDGALYDADNSTVSWEPTLDQAFQSYTFGFTLTDGIRQDSQTATVEVISNAIYHSRMDINPGWTLDSGWEWGIPLYRGIGENNDPLGGRTDENVVGYALWGDYRSNVRETQYATTQAIDCRGFKDIRLSFWRWLGIEAPGDQASVQVSNDGVAWTNLWTAGETAVLDDAWQFADYAVPADIADNQAEIYFRWGIGPTDGSLNNAGWNIDDVQVTGDPSQ